MENNFFRKIFNELNWILATPIAIIVILLAAGIIPRFSNDTVIIITPTSHNRLGQNNTNFYTPSQSSILIPPQDACANNGLPPRLQVGYKGYVLKDSEDRDSYLRYNPSEYGTIIDIIKIGEEFVVLDSPECIDNIYWWKVRYDDPENNPYDIVDGWIAEGKEGTYYLAPSN